MGRPQGKISVGDRVMVAYDPKGWPNDPARKLDRQEFVVARRKAVKKGTVTRWYWELHGAESEFGVPYGFCEEDLIIL